MDVTVMDFLIVCPLVFLAGVIDAIGGGGGLISLPAYLLAGVPMHNAIATNKLSSACGTTLATGRFIKNKLIDFKLAVPSILTAMLGSGIGAKLSMIMDEKVMEYLLFLILPVTAFVVLNKKLFDRPDQDSLKLTPRTYIVVTIAAFVIGMYDGFYGPGTGTFLIIAFTLFAKMGVGNANAQAKIINLTTNITSLMIFIMNGQVLFSLGVAAALCNMAGGYIGAGLAMKQGSKAIKPVILIVLGLLFLKILGVM